MIPAFYNSLSRELNGFFRKLSNYLRWFLVNLALYYTNSYSDHKRVICQKQRHSKILTKISHVRILVAAVITRNKLRQGAKAVKSLNSLINLGGIYLCPYGPELRTDYIDQSEES